ncbi:lamin tail domain-containing protein [Agromyces sp. LHK192]|uniref:lamin tail domain-containing protein n=1 Tax=Agromyces sp. LHK192 TaxID=2498704 RepID=UPI000FDC0254|nr:lamin tail domain-containing protein [Agromyces sp. LHK192]
MPVPTPTRRAAAMLAAAAVAASGLAISASAPALAADAGVVVNEIWYDGVPADAIELYNTSAEPVDVSGWKVQDDKLTETGVIPAGTTIGPGGFLVLAKDATPGFPFGLGKGDAVTLLDAADVVVDSYAYEATAPLADWSRCADGGEWAHATAVTLGAPNTCDPVEEPAVPAAAVLNEIDSGPADWVELINPGATAFDLSGFELRDNSDDHRWFFAEGATIDAGERLVVEADTVGTDADGAPLAFGDPIGIGGADAIRLFDPTGTLLDDYSWSAHPAIDGDEASASWARCPDATGSWGLAHVTKGAANDCVPPAVAINEVESNGDATDWVEVVNTGAAPVDLSGWTLMDGDPVGHAADVTPLPVGTSLAPGAFFVFDQNAHFGFGLGTDDRATVRDAAGTTVAEYAWGPHAAVTYARCPDGTGEFADSTASTKGAPNACDGGPGGPGEPGDPAAQPWPGSPDVTVVDDAAMFLEDSSGLDVQATAEGTFLWAVDNGTGTFWKLAVDAAGGATFADGWETGKRARFQRDADDPGAAGPDAEGITVDGDGGVYLASERDNSDKGVNQNVVLAVDADAPGPDVVADQEWDLTASLPAVAANTGIEAVEWVADTVLEGLLLDANTGAAYDPADYPGHGDGLFFVAVEDNGHVYAFALGADGSIAKVAEIDPGLGGVMALDYDIVLDRLWAVCDDGCEGESVQIAFTGAEPEITRFARPAGMPNLNNEGFATVPTSLSSVEGAVALRAEAATAAAASDARVAVAEAAPARAAFWFADGVQPGALRLGTVPGAAIVEPAPPGDGGTAVGPGGGTTGQTPAVAGRAGLASTGVDDGLLALIPVALFGLAAGAALLVIARRRRTARVGGADPRG